MVNINKYPNHFSIWNEGIIAKSKKYMTTLTYRLVDGNLVVF